MKMLRIEMTLLLLYTCNKKLVLGEDCKKRWINLRDYYIKKKKNLGTGSAATGRDREKLDMFRFLEESAFEHRK